MDEKVYVLDYDIISPLGLGKDKLKESLRTNFSTEKEINSFYTEGLELKVAAEIKTDLKFLYKNENHNLKEIAGNDRKFELVLAIYSLMEKRLKGYFNKSLNKRAGVILGVGADTTYFPMLQDVLSVENDKLQDKKMKSYESDWEKLFYPYDIHSIFLAEKLNLAAFQKSILTACASSTQAISFGANSIHNNEADIVLCGGTDSILNQLAFMLFDKLGALSHNVDRIGNTCKPFDIERSGTIAGEASGLCVLASEKFIKEHEIKPKFELIGYGNSLDAYKITAPDPSGKGVIKAIQRAIERSNISIDDIDYVNLHGTGTYLNDEAESNAFSELFGESLESIPVSSTKDRHGHAIAAAGIQEFAVLCSSMEENLVPGIMNLKNPIQKKYFNPLKNSNIKKEINVGLTCNYAFGGINSALIIKKC